MPYQINPILLRQSCHGIRKYQDGLEVSNAYIFHRQVRFSRDPQVVLRC